MPTLGRPARRRDSCRTALELAEWSTVAFLLWQPTIQTDREALPETHGPPSPGTCCLVTRTGTEDTQVARLASQEISVPVSALARLTQGSGSPPVCRLVLE